MDSRNNNSSYNRNNYWNAVTGRKLQKYVKVVIGVYILFSIVSPVITKVTGSEFRVSDIYDINSYIEASTKSTQDYAEINKENQIKQIYETNLKKIWNKNRRKGI